MRPTKYSDIVALKDRLRKSDVDEVWASTHQTPEEALVMSRTGSTCCQTVLHKRVPVAIFGCAPTDANPGRAGVWFLASDDLGAMWLSFLRMSKECVARMLDEYPLLYNWVDARNAQSIAWLKWCRAKIERAKPFGPENLPFHFFTIRRQDYV